MVPAANNAAGRLVSKCRPQAEVPEMNLLYPDTNTRWFERGAVVWIWLGRVRILADPCPEYRIQPLLEASEGGALARAIFRRVPAEPLMVSLP